MKPKTTRPRDHGTTPAAPPSVPVPVSPCPSVPVHPAPPTAREISARQKVPLRVVLATRNILINLSAREIAALGGPYIPCPCKSGLKYKFCCGATRRQMQLKMLRN